MRKKKPTHYPYNVLIYINFLRQLSFRCLWYFLLQFVISFDVLTCNLEMNERLFQLYWISIINGNNENKPDNLQLDMDMPKKETEESIRHK